MSVIESACWCGSRAAALVGTFPKPDNQGQWNLVQCEGCSVLALHPQPTGAELAAAYSTEYYGGSERKFIAPIAALIGLFQGGRARRVAKLVQSRGGGAGRILDVGCGNGGFLMQMKQRGFAVEGTEWTAESQARIPSNSNIAVHVGDLVDISLPHGVFDAITLWHVFEHLRRPRETLAKIRTLLRPEGVLMMSMPNAESPQAERYGAHWFHHDPPRHLFGFGPHSITLLLEDSGFRVHRISTRSFEQNPFGEIQSALNARGFPRDRLYGELKGTSNETVGTRLCDIARMAALLPRAVTRDFIESSRGEGATMTIEARLRT